MTLKFHAETPPFDDRIHLRMLLKGENGERSVATGIKFVDLSPSHPYEQNPLLTMRASEAQDLMDALWAAGIRPTEGRGSAGAMDATQKHLADLQRVAFTLLDRDENGALLSKMKRVMTP